MILGALLVRFNNKEISELDDSTLLAARDQCGQILIDRAEAGKHDKFKKMPFPSPNPKFIEMKNEIENEIKKRKL